MFIMSHFTNRSVLFMILAFFVALFLSSPIVNTQNVTSSTTLISTTTASMTTTRLTSSSSSSIPSTQTTPTMAKTPTSTQISTTNVHKTTSDERNLIAAAAGPSVGKLNLPNENQFRVSYLKNAFFNFLDLFW